MIITQHKIIKQIPLLEVVAEKNSNQPLPTVFFYHGLSNVKEAMLVYGYELAKRGIRCILPDALYHGERSDGKEINEHYLDLFTIIDTSIKEFPILVDELAQNEQTITSKIAVAGLSMGGITTCGLLRQYPEIVGACCLMGIPEMYQYGKKLVNDLEAQGTLITQQQKHTLEQLHALDLSEVPEKLAGRPVHFWHGTEDELVPYSFSYLFYQQYKDTLYGENLSYHLTQDGHKVPYPIAVQMAEFFQRILV